MTAEECLRVLDRWSSWGPLANCWQGPAIPLEPGLYRLRRAPEQNQNHLDYIGETGVTLRHRLRQLAGIYRPDMPYRDPHTAGPALWALRVSSNCSFEASVVTVQGDKRQRKGLE